MSQHPIELFFFDRSNLDQYQAARTEEKKRAVPSSGYINKIVKFFDGHYRVGKLLMEHVKLLASANTAHV